MRYVIYPDVFFSINFVMNVISFVFIKKLVRNRRRCWRCLLSAAVGGVYACVCVITPAKYRIVKGIISYLVIILLMVIISYGYDGMKILIKNTILVYLISFATGGISNVLYYRFQIRNMPLIILVIIMISVLVLRGMNAKMRISSVCYEVILEHNNTKMVVDALMDTGNSLIEPYGKRPVSIIEEEVSSKLIEGDDIHLQKGYMKIPYHSLGRSDGMVDGFVADAMYIKMENDILIKRNVVLGVYKGKLACEGGYRMILNPEVLKDI